jgi:hypothetical protein
MVVCDGLVVGRSGSVVVPGMLMVLAVLGGMGSMLLAMIV